MSRVFVIGGANIDISGSGFEALKLYDSNPGDIKITYGGVGRNIAENLALLQEKVYFISVFSQDNFGKGLYDDLVLKKIDLSYSKIVDNYSSSIYLAILDDKNDMYLGMSDMKILNELDIKMIDKVLSVLKNDDILVVDTNLSQPVIEYTLKNACCYKVMDPISSIKALKVKDLLGHIDIFKPNKYEAQVFSKVLIEDKKSANYNIDYFLNFGVKEIIISMADEGVILADNTTRVWFKHKSLNIVNATGGGDAFLSAYIKSRINNNSLLDAGKFAIGAAVVTIKCKDTVNSELCDKMILEEIERLNIKEIDLCT